MCGTWDQDDTVCSLSIALQIRKLRFIIRARSPFSSRWTEACREGCWNAKTQQGSYCKYVSHQKHSAHELQLSKPFCIDLSVYIPNPANSRVYSARASL